ncbi:MAG: hypothetical protein HFACDABA_02750 [Anaerolineales bacterium]|nr:hypothetical protein [Anaerolineales bacterium]
MIIIPAFDFFLLLCTIAGMVWWQKGHGRLEEKQVALIMSLYGTVFIITSVHPIYLSTHYREVLIFEFALLLVVWLIGYPFTRWIYRQFRSKK